MRNLLRPGLLSLILALLPVLGLSQDDQTTLPLQNGRFQVTVDWTGAGGGEAHAVPLTDETGTFWFFNASNAEVLVKVLDGTAINGHYWVFHGPMTDLAYTLTVVDTQTNLVRAYTKHAGSACGDADTTAFPDDPSNLTGDVALGSQVELAWRLEDFNPENFAERPGFQAGRCLSSSTALCLQGGRFKVQVNFDSPVSEKKEAVQTLRYSDESGFFLFFSATNVEVGVKVLDGTAINGKFWVFVGSGSDVGYTVRIQDTQTGLVKLYDNPAGTYCGQFDLQAFDP